MGALRLVGTGDAQAVTGEGVLAELAEMAAGLLTQRLREIPEDDPLRSVIEGLASRAAGLISR